MAGARPDAVAATWFALIAATLASYFTGHGATGSTRLATVLVMAIAAIKARLVLRQFMELATAPPAWRRAGDGWIVLVVGGVIAIYFFGW